jgi:hypothetical protein
MTKGKESYTHLEISESIFTLEFLTSLRKVIENMDNSSTSWVPDAHMALKTYWEDAQRDCQEYPNSISARELLLRISSMIENPGGMKDDIRLMFKSDLDDNLTDEEQESMDDGE